MCPVEPVKVEGARVEVSKKIKDGLFDSGPESFVERGTKAIRAGARMHVVMPKPSGPGLKRAAVISSIVNGAERSSPATSRCGCNSDREKRQEV